MGLATLPRLRDELAAAGYATTMQAVLVESGGTGHARVMRGQLDDMVQRAGRWSAGGPVLIMLGGTVSIPSET